MKTKETHMKTMINTIYPAFALFALACFGFSPAAQGGNPHATPTPTATITPTPTPSATPTSTVSSEDRGNFNSAAEGVNALNPATTGAGNTAHGWFSLFSNISGSSNTANGVYTLSSNITGNYNTATGNYALYQNQTASNNTAVGWGALYFNDASRSGLAVYNTAIGSAALNHNIDGDENTAIGGSALASNDVGSGNTCVGSYATQFNTTGSDNTAIGRHALNNNVTGSSNTAIGDGALALNDSGNGNVAVGVNSGNRVHSASNVICLGSNVFGGDVDNTAWIGNVYGVTTQSGTTAPVIVSDSGQLGIMASSERFKKDISTMEKASEAILSLRPVTFHYKTDTKGTPQFGLIAEEVAKVNPALVLPDKEGKPYTVRYDAVNAMLLNEFLKEHRNVEALQASFAQQQRDFQATVAQQQKQIEALTAGLQKVSAQLEASKPPPQMVNNP
jgi:hypothetical protein